MNTHSGANLLGERLFLVNQIQCIKSINDLGKARVGEFFQMMLVLSTRSMRFGVVHLVNVKIGSAGAARETQRILLTQRDKKRFVSAILA